MKFKIQISQKQSFKNVDTKSLLERGMMKRAKLWDGLKNGFWVAEVKQERAVSFLCLDGSVMETNTKALVLKLQNQTGILAMLDEECLRPGTVTDDTFLEKLNQVCATHQHFESRMSKCSRFLNDTSLPHSCFRIQHYAGKVPGEAREYVGRLLRPLNDVTVMERNCLS